MAHFSVAKIIERVVCCHCLHFIITHSFSCIQSRFHHPIHQEQLCQISSKVPILLNPWSILSHLFYLNSPHYFPLAPVLKHFFTRLRELHTFFVFCVCFIYFFPISLVAPSQSSWLTFLPLNVKSLLNLYSLAR